MQHDQPERRVRCPRCNREVETYVRNGIERLGSHSMNGGTTTCYRGSHLRVEMGRRGAGS